LLTTANFLNNRWCFVNYCEFF